MALAGPAAAVAQTPGDPPCPPGAAPAATLRAGDAEDGDRALTATHTIVLTLESSDGGEVTDEFTLVLPPGAKAIRDGPSPAFRVDSPGPVPVTAMWTHLVIGDGSGLPHGSTCTASTETTFALEPPKPLSLRLPAARKAQMVELDWLMRIGKGADLRPVEARLRGVRRARLPGAAAPVQTISLGLRTGDRPMLTGTGRVLRSAGWRFRFGPLFRDELPVRMYGFEKSRRRGFGFDLNFVQAGRSIGRTRAVGRCEFTVVGRLCRFRTARAPRGVSSDSTSAVASL